jgi:hypothetical protein
MTESDRSTAIPFDPDLSDEFADRFDALTDELIEYPRTLDREVALKDEIKKIKSGTDTEDPDIERIRYIAVLEVLLDLVEVGHEFWKNTELKVVPPDPAQYSDNPQEYKKKERKILEKERQVQFQEDSVRRFIRELESGSTNGSVRSLIVDGETLYSDLAPLQEMPRDDIIEALETEIQPYIQVVEKGERDDHTNLDLMDIWRYFRYTWLTPYHTVPGRNVNFLIRDAARDHHPVMGIASLGSAMMNITPRDEYIGWTIDSLEERLERNQRELEYEEQLPKEERTPERKTKTVTRTEYLETKEEYEDRIDRESTEIREALEHAILESIENIKYSDFVEEYDALSKERFQTPDDTVFEILAEIEEESEAIIDDPEIDDTNPDKLDSWEARSQTPLFRKKRADTLQKLLRDRQYFVEHESEDDREFLANALGCESGRRAIKTALKELKKERAGSDMMNIMVCGAIPPYNEILGGKLVAMSLCGPKVIEAYKEKYGGHKSEIASAMKGEAVEKSNELVFYDTTSLFEVGSAQYSRIRIPVEEDEEIEYKQLGYTSGYGSIQFGPSTREPLAKLNELVEGRQVVRGRFGEGVSPRLRKIRRGLKNCGLDGELLRHDSRRIVYGVELARNGTEYLRGEVESPEYYWDFVDIEEEQQSIYNHWKTRWVSKRVQKDDVLERIQEFETDDLLLSQELDFKQKQLSDFIINE